MASTLVRAALLLSVVVSFAALYGPVVVELVRAWSDDPNYSHGFFIPPLAAYLAWQRRDALRSTPVMPSLLGLAIVVASALLLAAGRLGAEFFATRLALITTLAGVVAYAWGLRHLRILAFPIGALVLMVPPPAIIFNELAVPLQMAAARFGEAALSTAGIPVVREGNLIVLADTTLEVAEACSGIRSLVSLTALAVFYGYFTERRVLARIAVVALAIPIAILANALRVAGTGIAAHLVGAQAAEGFFHTFSGWIVFATALAFLMAFSELLRRTRRAEATC